MKNKFSIALSLAVIMSMLLTSIGLADNIVNDVVVVDGDKIVTITSGGSANVSFQIKNTNSNNSTDPQNSCNAADATPATVTINTPAGVTVDTSGLAGNQATLTFTACDVFKSATFSSNAVGSYEITVSVSDTGAGTYNTNPAKFSLVVNAPTNTPPSVSVTGVTDGASYEIGSVPTATCNVVDTEDGNSSFAATLSAITGSLAAFGLGSQTAYCAYTDNGGLSATPASATYSIVDTTDPVITFVSRTTANSNGWNNGDVTVKWSCTDNGSGVVAASVSETVSTEGENQSATGTCKDNAGNSASNTQSGINIDKTVPTASASAAPAANGFGWNNTGVTVSYSGLDDLSGIDFCDAADVFNAEGANQSASGTCTDKAGNVSAPATATINIDLSLPLVALVGGPANGSSYYFGSVPAAPTCEASDALSGLNGTCTVSGYSALVGSHTVSASASDKADNSASASASYSVLAWTLNGFYQPVDMNGVYNVVKGGSTVPLKFEVFAGPAELTSTSVVASFVQTKIACDGTSPSDEIEVVTTGGTSLRYDTTGGQFIQNWQTPKLPGQCYRVTMTTQDGSSLVTFFKLK